MSRDPTSPDRGPAASSKGQSTATDEGSSSDFDFVVPDDQRPFAWGSEQALQLLDDLEAAPARGGDDLYLLGSLVLVKTKEDSPQCEVIDGQRGRRA